MKFLNLKLLILMLCSSGLIANSFAEEVVSYNKNTIIYATTQQQAKFEISYKFTGYTIIGVAMAIAASNKMRDQTAEFSSLVSLANRESGADAGLLKAFNDELRGRLTAKGYSLEGAVVERKEGKKPPFDYLISEDHVKNTVIVIDEVTARYFAASSDSAYKPASFAVATIIKDGKKLQKIFLKDSKFGEISDFQFEDFELLKGNIPSALAGLESNVRGLASTVADFILDNMPAVTVATNQ